MDVYNLKINFENNRRNRSSLAILYLVVFFIVITYFVKGNYIDFETVRSLYMPVIGISMIAILFDYMIFAHVFLVASLYALIAKYSRETVNINIIILFGLIFAIVLEMLLKLNKKKK